MSNIILYDPEDVVVANRVTHYLQSVNTPDYDDVIYKLVNPDMSLVSGVSQKYWKVVSEEVVEMSQAEKDAVDEAQPSPGGYATEGVAVFANQSSKDIVYETPYENDTTNVLITPTGNINCWPTNESKTGFTLNASTDFTGNIYWTAKGN